MPRCQLIVDTRESGVSRHEFVSQYTIMQMTVGDYAVVVSPEQRSSVADAPVADASVADAPVDETPAAKPAPKNGRKSKKSVNQPSEVADGNADTPAADGENSQPPKDHKILAIIERKSLQDYGASLKDGRSENKRKLLELRSATGCKIIFIIEGPMAPSPTTLFGGIAFAHIESSIFRLALEHGICVLRTANTFDTAKLLDKLVNAAQTMIDRGTYVQHSDVDETPVENLKEILCAQRTKSDTDIATEMWASFSGITTMAAPEFMAKWCIADIIMSKVSRPELAAFKMSNKKAIGKRAIDSLSAVDATAERRLLKCVPGISADTAKNLLSERKLSDLIAMDLTEMAAIVVGKKAIGASRAQKIHDMFHFKLNDANRQSHSVNTDQ